MRDQELCVAAHLFAEEVNTESDLVGENLATKGDELYFQDLPIYNKLNISDHSSFLGMESSFYRRSKINKYTRRLLKTRRGRLDFTL